MKRYLKFILFISYFSLGLNTWANGDFQSFVSRTKPHNISAGTWDEALRAYFSYFGQCSGADCACVLAIGDGAAQGADDTSVQIWIGTFAGGGSTELWAGWGSRKASAASAPAKNVSKKLGKCKRRNGGGQLQGNEVCVQYSSGPSCRDISVFQSIMNQLDIPESAGYTSFYFSAPMQNETYKFHDFYHCENGPPCPSTLGCLGLERHAMKGLCLNHMGSDGSNGYDAEPTAGGVYLHYHNTGRPQANVGNPEQGFQKFANGACQNVPRMNLSSGSLARTDRVPSGSGGSAQRGGRGGSSAMSAFEQGMQSYADSQSSNQQEGQLVEGENDIAQAIAQQCEATTQKSCPNVERGIISDYCQDIKSYDRSSCDFEKI